MGIKKIQDLNKDADYNLNKSKQEQKNLYLYKKIGHKGFIKEIELVNPSEGDLDSSSTEICKNFNKDFNSIKTSDINSENDYADVNYGTYNTTSEKDKRYILCVNKITPQILSIDTAFVYKDNQLYFFRGYNFYKMKNRPTNDVLFVDDSYPLSISNKWTRGKSKASSDNVVDDCSLLSNKETCNKADNCTYDETKEV